MYNAIRFGVERDLNRVDNNTLWKSVLGEIQVDIEPNYYRTWFERTSLLRRGGDEVVVGVPNTFTKTQLEKKYSSQILKILKKNGVSGVVKYQVCSPPKSSKSEVAHVEEVFVERPTALNPSTATPFTMGSEIKHGYREGLNQKYLFENFVVGSGSELAYAACQSVAKNPGNKYNPLFIYGGVGIGKTHLIQAVGNAALKNNPALRVVYVTVEQFVQEFTDAIRYKKAGAFTQHYRNTDILIVDDIQFIAGKQKTQEEFFHTFNVLHQANKQVILSSDKPPHAIPTLEERLKSRFQMGMAIDMQTPDLETRCAILKLKADLRDFNLDEECVEFLANSFTTNIRELEGALNQLGAYCDIKGVEPTIQVAEAVFAKMTSRFKNITPKQVVEKVIRYYQIKQEDLLGPKRDKDIVLPRQIAMYLLRHQLGLSYPKIAQELGRRDHTTAMHSVSKIEKELAIDSVLGQQVQDIRGALSV